MWLFFPPPFLSPDRARLIFAFSQRPYHLRAWHRLPLVKPANSPPLIELRHALGMFSLSRGTFVTAGSGERRIYSQAINS